MRFLPALLVLFWVTTPARATEQAPYEVLKQDGRFEVREYPALTLMRTPAGDGDFMRLFRYISGSNEAEQKIAMTAPVLMQQEGPHPGMSFIMPQAVAAGAAPAPTEESVAMDTLPAGRFAVYRYSGGRNEPNEQQALAKLRAWVGEQQLEVAGEPLFGYFDPPWVPTFLRRNEVMLRLAGAQP